MARSKPRTLPTVAPVPPPTLPCAKAVAAERRFVAHVRFGPGVGGTHGEIEDHSGRDQGYADGAHIEADALLFEEADDAVYGGEPEGATAGQEQGVRGSDGAYRSEAVGLARTRGGAPYVHADDGPTLAFEDNGGASSEPFPVRGVADEHARHVAEVIQHAGVKSPCLAGVPATPTRLCRRA